MANPYETPNFFDFRFALPLFALFRKSRNISIQLLQTVEVNATGIASVDEAYTGW